MFRKSLNILVGGALLALVGTIAYAALRLSGPESALAEAESLLNRGQAARAVQVLEIAERSAALTNDVTLRHRLRRLRYRAYTVLQNPAAALHDVDLLIADGLAGDETLRLDQIRLLAQTGDGAAAKAAAQRFLAERPDSSRALELAGESCQTIYQPDLRRLRDAVLRDVGQHDRERAREALLAYLYRADGDPEVARAGEALRRIYGREPRLAAAWSPLWQNLRLLRQRVQEGLGYFFASLEAGGEPVAAFRAVATALDQSRRTDDLLVVCEIQRLLHEHAYVDEAGAFAAWALVHHREYRAAIATVERWLPTGKAFARHAEGLLTAAADELLTARGYAAGQLRDDKELGRVGVDVWGLRERGFTATQAMLHHHALRRALFPDGQDEQQTNRLRHGTESLLRQPPAVGRPDLGSDLALLWLEHLRQVQAPEDEIDKVLNLWTSRRPDRIEPHLHRVDELLRRGRAVAALAAFDQAKAVDPLHPELFALRLRIARQHNEGTEQDGAGLLRQCIRLRTLAPEVSDPIGYLLCAETALATAPAIAAASARLAIDAFPQAVEPRRLELEALLELGQFAEAARAADRVPSSLRGDARLLELILRALRHEKRPTRGLLRDALALATPQAALQLELLRTALEAAPTTAIVFAHHAAPDAEAPAELAFVTALAQALGGDAAAAAAALGRAPAADPSTPAALRARAVAAWLLAAAPDTPDDALARQLRGHWQRFGLAQAPQSDLLAAASQLPEDRPRTRHELFAHTLAAARPEERSGVLFVKAGRVALQCGEPAAAIDRWTAAIAFADGLAAAEDLARLQLVQGDEARARAVYTLARSPRDPALAALLGEVALAADLTAAALARDKADLLAHGALSAFGQPAMCDWRPVDDAARRARLLLLSCCADDDLAALSTARAEAVLAAQPDSQTTRLLLARTVRRSGEVARAAELLDELRGSGLDTPVFWRELALAAQEPGYVQPAACVKAMMDAATAARLADSPVAVAYGLDLIAEGFRSGGFAELADEVRVQRWLALPDDTAWTPADLARLRRYAPPAAAAATLLRTLAGPHATPRGPLLDLLADRMAAAVAADAALRANSVATARALLALDGARWPLVHFLLQHDPAPKQDPAKELLRAWLRTAAAGRDDPQHEQAAIAALVRVFGLEDAVLEVDAALADVPTALPLWTARATLLQSTAAGADAVRDLRNVLRHADSPVHALAQVTLAAKVHAFTDGDAQRLDALPEALRSTPAGAYARGLASLRLGRPDDAVQHLGGDHQDPDGMHLYAAALAHLQANGKDGVTAARALFERLLRDYASSSLARNAGSFVRQLSPRAASEAVSETKR
jgi:hypothetical protein